MYVLLLNIYYLVPTIFTKRSVKTAHGAGNIPKRNVIYICVYNIHKKLGIGTYYNRYLSTTYNLHNILYGIPTIKIKI